MKTPPKIATPRSADAVTAEVRRLLRAAEVRDQVPTPKSAVIACAQLVETGELDLAEYEESLSERASDFFHKAISKVLGFLDRRTKIIYVDPGLHDSRKTFVTYHEVVHKIAYWQHFTLTEDDDVTLSLECETLFEAEANYGAAEILFQCDRFEAEARDYEMSIDSALYLSQRYDASYHSSLRRFAERSNRACLLLVLKPTRRKHEDGTTSFHVSYSIPSKPFTLQFGEPLDLAFIEPDHELGRILNNGSHGEILLQDLKGFSRPCQAECFSNQYHRFVLLYPKDMPRSGRVVVIRPS